MSDGTSLPHMSGTAAPAASSITTQHPLVQLYLTANKQTFMNPSLDDAIAAWPKHFSKSLVVYQNSTTMDYNGFLDQMKGAKGMWPIIDVRYKLLTASEPAEGVVEGDSGKGKRTVGSAEYVWIPSHKLWFDTVIIMTFGEKGTEDEDKVVEFRETMTPCTTERNPDAAEWQSIA